MLTGIPTYYRERKSITYTLRQTVREYTMGFLKCTGWEEKNFLAQLVLPHILKMQSQKVDWPLPPAIIASERRTHGRSGAEASKVPTVS